MIDRGVAVTKSGVVFVGDILIDKEKQVVSFNPGVRVFRAWVTLGGYNALLTGPVTGYTEIQSYTTIPFDNIGEILLRDP